MGFGANQRPRSLVRDLCETQTAECRVSLKKGDWRLPPALLLARGENRLFSPEKSGRFVFAEPAFALSAKRTVTILVFRLRRKTATEQKEIAFGRRRCAGASSLFMSFRELQKNILVIFYTLFGAIRGSRAANHDHCKTGAAERTVLPKRVNVPLLPEKTASLRNRGETGFSPQSPTKFFFCMLPGDSLFKKRICVWSE